MLILICTSSGKGFKNLKKKKKYGWINIEIASDEVTFQMAE